MGIAANSLYEDAEVYDVLHAPGTASEVRGLLRIAARFGRARDAGPLTWLEPACGTGRYLRALARRGERAIGFDLSEAMISYARGAAQRERDEDDRKKGRQAPGPIRLFVADMTEFASGIGEGAVDVAFNLINTIRHLGSDRALGAHLAEVRSVLRPDGVYIVGLSLTAYGLEFPSEDVWNGRRGDLRVKQVVQYVPPLRDEERRERVYSHLVLTRGGTEEHRDSSYWLRCYNRRQWESAVKRAGFVVCGVTDADGRDVALASYGYGVWVLKPAPDGAAPRRR